MYIQIVTVGMLQTEVNPSKGGILGRTIILMHIWVEPSLPIDFIDKNTQQRVN